MAISGMASAHASAQFARREAAQRRATSQTGAMQDIIKQMQAAQQKATAANEQRYQQILGQFENLGQAGRTRIAERETQEKASATQDLTSRGLGGTTITSAVKRGIGRESELSRQQLEEGIAVRKAGVMERRTDVGPDMGMFANLLQTMAQGQSGGRTIVSGGLGPMARRGLTGTGKRSMFGPSEYDMQLAKARAKKKVAREG